VKFDRIAAFGDSWVWGDELIDPSGVDLMPHSVENTSYRESHCFAGIIARHYNVPVENFAIAGGSLQSTIWNYIWWQQNRSNHDSTLILVGLTDAGRMSYYNPNHVAYPNDPPWNKYVHSAWVHYSPNGFSEEWVKMVKGHTVLTGCYQSWEMNYLQAVLFFDGRPNVIQFDTINAQAVAAPKSLLWPKQSLRSILTNHKNCWAPKKHPNEQGHQIIADLLISHIDSCIIQG
jgi:hypothetical protein